MPLDLPPPRGGIRHQHSRATPTTTFNTITTPDDCDRVQMRVEAEATHGQGSGRFRPPDTSPGPHKAVVLETRGAPRRTAQSGAVRRDRTPRLVGVEPVVGPGPLHVPRDRIH